MFRIQLGVRLSVVILALVTGNIVALMLGLFLPIVNPMGYLLGDEPDVPEIKELLSGIKKDSETKLAAVKTELERVINSGLEKALQVDQLTESLKGLGIEPDKYKELVEAVEKQGEEIRKMYEKKNTTKSLEELVEEKADAIKAIAKGAPGVELKIQRNKTLVQTSALTNSTLGMRVEGVGQLPFLATVMSGLFRHVPVAPNSNGVIRWIDQEAITRGAAMTAENATKGESEISWIERSMTVKKITDSIPVTKEAFDDIGFIRGEIERLLDINLALKEDQQYWSGSGVGENMTGIYTYAPAFNAGAYAGTTVLAATLYDLLAILRVEVTDAKQSKYMPNAVAMNPRDILRYKLAKGTDGHYVLPPFIMSNGEIVDGMRVVESSQVTANTLALGDFRYATSYDLEGTTVEVGFVNDQFIKNAKTILAEKREMLLVRNVDLDAFLKVTDIDAAVAAVTAP